MSKRSPRLQFSDNERSSPKLKKAIQKADKKADKLDKAEAKIPKKTVKRKERVVDAEGRVTTRLYFEEVDKKKPPSKLTHATAAAPINSALATAHREVRQSEDENVGTESAHKVEEVAEGGMRIVDSAYRSHKLKPYREAAQAEAAADKANLRALNKQSKQQNPEFSSNPYSRWQQKRAIKKEYMAAKAGKSTSNTIKASETTAKAAKKAAKETKKTSEFIAKHKKGALIVAGIGLLMVFMLNVFSSCSILVQSGMSAFGATTYPVEDSDMMAAETQYCALEAELQDYLDNYERTHDYDTISETGEIVITINGQVYGDESEDDDTTPGRVVTNGGRLNLRTGAGMSYEIIDQLRNGEEVTVIGTEGDWYKVIVPEKTGYVHSNYLELLEKAEENSEIDSAMLMLIMNMMFQSMNTGGTENTDESLAFTPPGNLSLIDDFLQIEIPGTEDTEQVEKQFITVQSKSGNTFYIVIDRNGETENVYFLNLVDEADLMALIEGEDGAAAPTCSCTNKCVVGDINTNCEICHSNMSECVGKEPVVEPEPTEPTEEPTEEKKGSNPLPILILIVALGAGGAVYWFKFRKPKTKTAGNSDLDDYDYGQDDDDEYDETEIDDADLMAEADTFDEEK